VSKEEKEERLRRRKEQDRRRRERETPEEKEARFVNFIHEQCLNKFIVGFSHHIIHSVQI